jgi:ABC-type nitrate/sulfonate/bicarbonate transport system substrate-binding protein
MISHLRAFLVLFAITALIVAGCGESPAQKELTISVGSISGPLSNPIMWNILKANKFDAKHGFTLDIRLYPSIAAFYGGFTTGDVDVIMGGPTNLQKLRNEAVPLKIIATGLKLSDLSIFTRVPALKKLSDLKGKTLAIDMGGSQYQVVAICARGLGMTLKTDVQLVNANFALSKAQLIAGRVDAAMIAEPLATLTASENPDLHVIFNGKEGWKELTGHEGWETVIAAREELLKRSPDSVARLIAAMKDAVEFIKSNPDDADRIVVDTVKLAPGVFKTATLNKKMEFEVNPAWGAQRESIREMMELAVAAGFVSRTPDPAIIYTP